MIRILSVNVCRVPKKRRLLYCLEHSSNISHFTPVTVTLVESHVLLSNNNMIWTWIVSEAFFSKSMPVGWRKRHGLLYCLEYKPFYWVHRILDTSHCLLPPRLPPPPQKKTTTNHNNTNKHDLHYLSLVNMAILDTFFTFLPWKLRFVFERKAWTTITYSVKTFFFKCVNEVKWIPLNTTVQMFSHLP